MKHAYLVIAHSNWGQLNILLRMLDSEKTDFYIHIDKKIKNPPLEIIKNGINKSKVFVVQKYKVYWGSFELVQTELLLLNMANKVGYDYYHLLSGMDLPIKSKEIIDLFFENNNGYEFVHYDTEERLKCDKEITRRTKLFHFLQNYRRRYKINIFNEFFSFIERILLLIQIVLRVDRTKLYNDIEIKYGSQWFSITNELACYILSQEEFIYKLFKYTNCADELFVQTIIYNSKFRYKLYDDTYGDKVTSNMRLIDMKKRGNNGNPYTWQISDFDEILNSPCLFARKFNENVDKEIINKIINIVNM